MGAPAGRRAQVLGLLVLSAIGAELLAAYGDSTGDPAAVAFSVVFFGALYGAPALVARDLARRLGWGWAGTQPLRARPRGPATLRRPCG